MIDPEGMIAIGEAIGALVENGKCIHNGDEKILPTFRVTYENSAVRVLFYLTDDDIGTFEQFEVYMADGRRLFKKQGAVEKTEAEGLVVAFILKLQEVEE